MRFLFLDEANQQRAHDVALFAARPENWYRPGASTWVPGDRPQYVALIDDFRCVFTYTVDRDGDFYRHLTISTAGARLGKLPHPIAAFTLATWFGFTGGRTQPPADAHSVADGDSPRVTVGPGDDWQIGTNDEPFRHAVFAQRIGRAGGAP